MPDTSKEAVFMYYCDNVYNKSSEICINPLSLLPKALSLLDRSMLDELRFAPLFKMFDNVDSLILSDKDCHGLDYQSFMQDQQDIYSSIGRCWYKDEE